MAGRKGALILDTARQMFLERGYDATSLDDVAAAGGVSKTTVYNNFGDKESLFSAVVLSVTERAEQIISELSTTLSGDAPIIERLTAAGRTLAYSVLNPAVVQLRRLAISEALRFPGIVTAYWDRAPARTLALLTESFTQMAARGELDTDDPATGAQFFAYAVLGPNQDQALLQPNRPLTRAHLDEHVGKVVTAFLRAYAPGAHPPATSRLRRLAPDVQRQLPERCYEPLCSPVRVEAAWVGQHPNWRTAGRELLPADLGARLGERGAVRGHADHRQPARAQPAHLRAERPAARDQLACAEFLGPRGGPRHDVGDAKPELEQLPLLARMQPLASEARLMQRRPEPVARAGEVVAGGGRVQARVDSAEQDAQTWCGHIGDSPSGGRFQFGLGRPTLRHQDASLTSRTAGPPCDRVR